MHLKIHKSNTFVDQKIKSNVSVIDYKKGERCLDVCFISNKTFHLFCNEENVNVKFISYIKYKKINL